MSTGHDEQSGVEDFSRHRDLLFTVAYEITGSTADAEDVVSESWLRWAAIDDAARAEIDHPRAYLVRIVTRQALNRLRTRSRQREEYVGPWLPEPLLTAPDIADDVVLAESVSMAMMLVVQSLTPDERAVFVLHEVFGFGHDEIAEAIGKAPATVRQIAHRARSHVQARKPRFPQDSATTSEVAERFMAATATGDLQALMDVLAPDVVLLSDGGGKVRAALNPVVSADKVARLLVGLVTKSAPMTAEFALINGRPGALAYIDGMLDTAITIEIEGDRVTGVFMIRNPDKLAGVGPLRAVDR